MSIAELPQPVGGVIQFQSHQELSRWVKCLLCRRDHLDPEQFELQEVPLVRAGQHCGKLFKLRGPRAVTLRAIWSGDEGRVLFYDSSGTRFLQVSGLITSGGGDASKAVS